MATVRMTARPGTSRKRETAKPAACSRPTAAAASGAKQVWATLTASGEIYFDSVSMFVFFLLGGRFLEMTARQKAVSVTEALAKLLPAFAQKLINFPVDRSTEQRVVADLHVGDHVLVRAGDIVPADGRVVEGVSAADESLLTGESKPVTKKPGDLVTGALQVLRGARDGHEETQVARRGLAAADGGNDLVIDVHFHLVDALLGLDHLLGRFQAHVGERIDRLVQLRLHQPAHFEHVGGDGVEFGIELAGDVFVAHAGAPLDQPKRPVM